jgi:hypothetical protein
MKTTQIQVMVTTIDYTIKQPRKSYEPIVQYDYTLFVTDTNGIETGIPIKHPKREEIHSMTTDKIVNLAMKSADIAYIIKTIPFILNL